MILALNHLQLLNGNKFKAMIKRILSILVIIQFFSIGIISAQEIKRSEIIDVFNGEQYYLHTIKEGHTLYSLSQVYAVNVDEIIDANSYIKKGDDLPLGLILRIPYKEESGQKANVYKHTVEKGETLYSIARKYELNVSELYNANSGLTTDISIGQKIIIPGQEKVETTPIIEPIVEDTIIGETYIIHTVKEGETAYGISKEYNVSLNELEILNPTILSQDLRLGMEILIPISGKNIAAEQSDTILPLSCDCDEPILKENILQIYIW